MIKANILNNELKILNTAGKPFSVSDGIKFDTVEFEFPENWNGYTKTAVFTNDEGANLNIVLSSQNPLCISEKECYIPSEVLKPPHFYISVFGVLGDSVATTTKQRVIVLKSGYSEGDVPEEPTPTEYEQIVNIAAQAVDIAQSVRSDADSGMFKGEKGDKGEQGIQGVQGIQGEKGEKGDAGKDAVTDQVYDPDSENAQSGKAVAESIEDFRRNTLQEFAPMIRNSVSGSIIRVNDALDIEHELSVNLQSGNFIDYPYKDTTKTECGITFTDNGDGSITLNGEATDIPYFSMKNIMLPKGKYKIAFSEKEISGAYLRVGFVSAQNPADYSGYIRTTTNSQLMIEEDCNCSVFVCTDIGASIDNVTVAPQIYLTDFSDVTVSRYGKNLFDEKIFNRLFDGVLHNGTPVMEETDSEYIIRNGNISGKNYTPNKIFKENTVYTFRLNAKATAGSPRFVFRYTDGTTSTPVYITSENKTIIIRSDANKTVAYITVDYANNGYVYIKKGSIQLETGSKATSYEVYAEPQSVKANPDGTVEKLKSKAPI